MNIMEEQVREFNRTFRIESPKSPTMPDVKTQHLREDLIEEELREFAIANMSGDLVAAADAIGDLLYVVFGTAITYGIDANPVFDEIHRSNMSKLWTRDEFKNAIGEDATGNPEIVFEQMYAWNTPYDRAYIARRADGKIVKSPSYSPADVAGVLARQSPTRAQWGEEVGS